MLDLKRIEYELAAVLPGTQRIHLRLAGFRGGTVPALKLDGRRLQGSRNIARALEQLRPDPPLFPADPAARARADEAERWGDGVLVTDPPNAAALQVLASVRALEALADLRGQVSAHASAAAARELFPEYPEPVPRFLPPDWN